MENLKRNISIFYNPSWGSGQCRGNQICSYIDGKRNPTENYENDVCIWVKTIPNNFEKIQEHCYIDIADGDSLLPFIRKNPNIGVIASSIFSKTFLDALRVSKQIDNEVVLIPHHHCNHERIKRPERKIKTVGFIGHHCKYESLPKTLEKDLADIGLEFKYNLNFENRMDVSNFLQKIDIHICNRHFTEISKTDRRLKKEPMRYAMLKNHLKLANSSSFGIPTVSYQEISFKDEFDGCFVEALNSEDIITQCKRLKEDSVYYNDIANKAMERAEQFHIENIAPLYYSLGN